LLIVFLLYSYSLKYFPLIPAIVYFFVACFDRSMSSKTTLFTTNWKQIVKLKSLSMRLSIDMLIDHLFVHFLFDYMLMLWTIPVDTNQKYYFHKTNRPVRKLLFLVSFCSFCCFIPIIIVSTIARWFQPVKPTEKYKNYQLLMIFVLILTVLCIQTLHYLQ